MFPMRCITARLCCSA